MVEQESFDVSPHDLLCNEQLLSIIETENFDDFYAFILNQSLSKDFILDIAKIVVSKNWIRALEFLIVVHSDILNAQLDKERQSGLIHFALAHKKTEMVLLILSNMDNFRWNDSQGFALVDWAFYFNNDILVLKKMESVGLSLTRRNLNTGFCPFELASEPFLWVFAENAMWVDFFLTWKNFNGFYSNSMRKRSDDIILNKELEDSYALCRWCFLIGGKPLANWMGKQIVNDKKNLKNKGLKWHLFNYIESIVIECWEERFIIDLFNHFKI